MQAAPIIRQPSAVRGATFISDLALAANNSAIRIQKSAVIDWFLEVAAMLTRRSREKVASEVYTSISIPS